jgi:hypothetical protein
MSMSGLGADLAEMRDGLVAQYRWVLVVFQRISPVPVLVRGGLYLSAALALLLAVPLDVDASGMGLAFLAFALVPALWPRGSFPQTVILLAAAAWLATTLSRDTPISYPRLVALAGLLYLTHTLAALAAVLPYDAVVTRGVVRRWLLRAVPVLVLTAITGFLATVIPPWLGQGRYLLASLAGLAVMVGLAVYLTALIRRAN